jgi:hypothetical protein
MGVFEERTIAEDLSNPEAEAEDTQCQGKWGSVPAAAWRYPVRGQIRAKLEGRCLSYEEGSKKAQMPSDKPGELATDNGTRKPEGLGAVTVAAKGVESDGSGIHHH